MPDRRTFLSQIAVAAIGRLSLHASASRAQAAAFPTGDTATLRAHASAHGLFYGSAVDTALLRTDPVYRQLLATQCNILVPENAMKWAALHPAPDHYTFDQADEVLVFAEQHGIAVRGHNLCWHQALPPWFANKATPQNAAQHLTSHIQTVAGRYQGRIRAWDVVNEAISLEDGKPGGLRDSPWYRLLGPSYIELAFRIARAADPHALLTYNDYGIEYDHPASFTKRAAVLTLLRRLKAANVPIDAVGIQSHLDATARALGPGIAAFAEAARALGLKVFLTELDVNDDNLVQDNPALRDAAVSAVYSKYVTTMLTNPAVTDILTWGISDNHSWLNNTRAHLEKHATRQQRALPFDPTYHLKPAFYALRAALHSRQP